MHAHHALEPGREDHYASGLLTFLSQGSQAEQAQRAPLRITQLVALLTKLTQQPKTQLAATPLKSAA